MNAHTQIQHDQHKMLATLTEPMAIFEHKQEGACYMLTIAPSAVCKPTPIAEFSDPYREFKIGNTLQKTLYGSVRTAVQRKNGQQVAVKLSRKDLIKTKKTAQGQKVLEDPQEEINILKFLANTGDVGFGGNHIVRLLGVSECSKFKWSVFEFAEQGELFGHVTDGGVGTLSSKLWSKQLAKGLAYLHRNNIAHLDLSLENVLLDRSNAIKICDLGMALDLNKPYVLDRPGKVAYMSPEIFEGLQCDPKKSDVFSLGVCIFLLLTGVLPYNVPSSCDPCFRCVNNFDIVRLLDAWNLREKVSFQAADLLNNMLCKEEDRFTITEVLAHPWLTNNTPPNTPCCSKRKHEEMSELGRLDHDNLICVSNDIERV